MSDPQSFSKLSGWVFGNAAGRQVPVFRRHLNSNHSKHGYYSAPTSGVQCPSPTFSTARPSVVNRRSFRILARPNPRCILYYTSSVLRLTQTLSTTPAPTPSQSTGQVYYVSPGGSDANAGTASAPWRSIQAAAQHLQAGETAVLMDGTYEEGSIVFANSGTAANPITIKAQNKWGAVLSSISGNRPAISIDKSYITIEDLRISVSPNNSNSVDL